MHLIIFRKDKFCFLSYDILHEIWWKVRTVWCRGNLFLHSCWFKTNLSVFVQEDVSQHK